jgi:hypothetical protein
VVVDIAEFGLNEEDVEDLANLKPYKRTIIRVGSQYVEFPYIWR